MWHRSIFANSILYFKLVLFYLEWPLAGTHGYPALVAPGWYQIKPLFSHLFYFFGLFVQIFQRICVNPAFFIGKLRVSRNWKSWKNGGLFHFWSLQGWGSATTSGLGGEFTRSGAGIGFEVVCLGYVDVNEIFVLVAQIFLSENITC